MPDKNYLPNCGKGCIRCWKNKLKHANKLKKKQFPKQNIWEISINHNESRISYNDSSDEEEYSSNIEEYADKQIKTKEDYGGYNPDYSRIKIYKFIDIYDNYNAWLSENKQLYEPNKKMFIKEFRDYIPSDIINNDTCELEIID